MTNPTPLTPAAQACVTAFQKVDFESGHFTCEDMWIISREDMWIISREVAAAALRAAADQVVPSDPDMPERWEVKDEIRAELLAIAAELEGADG